MIRTIRFHPAARQDVAKAAAWYEARAIGLGETFVVELERLMDRLRPFPQAYPETLGVHRQASLSRFPYTVVYRCVDDMLVVIAVLHVRRGHDRVRSLIESR